MKRQYRAKKKEATTKRHKLIYFYLSVDIHLAQMMLGFERFFFSFYKCLPLFFGIKKKFVAFMPKQLVQSLVLAWAWCPLGSRCGSVCAHS